MRFVFSPAQFSVRMGAATSSTSSTSSTSPNMVLSAALQQDSCVQLQGLPSNFLEIKKLEKSEHAKASRSLLLAKIASNERMYNARLEAVKFGGTPPSRTAAPDWHSFAYNDSFYIQQLKLRTVLPRITRHVVNGEMIRIYLFSF